MKCDRCGIDEDALAGRAGEMLCARCEPSLHSLTVYRKVRLLAMSVEVADGHLALMLDGSNNILICREDWQELRSFMDQLGGFEFYQDSEIKVGTDVPATLTISKC